MVARDQQPRCSHTAGQCHPPVGVHTSTQPVLPQTPALAWNAAGITTAPARGSCPGDALWLKQAISSGGAAQDCLMLVRHPAPATSHQASATASPQHHQNKHWDWKIWEICPLRQGTYRSGVNFSGACQGGKPFCMLLAKLSIILMSSK